MCATENIYRETITRCSIECQRDTYCMGTERPTENTTTIIYHKGNSRNTDGCENTTVHRNGQLKRPRYHGRIDETKQAPNKRTRALVGYWGGCSYSYVVDAPYCPSFICIFFYIQIYKESLIRLH